MSTVIRSKRSNTKVSGRILVLLLCTPKRVSLDGLQWIKADTEGIEAITVKQLGLIEKHMESSSHRRYDPLTETAHKDKDGPSHPIRSILSMQTFANR
jgi:hypothetical protein